MMLSIDGRAPKAPLYRFCLIIILTAFTCSGCALKLFEYTLDQETARRVEEKIIDPKQKGIVDVLKQRGQPTLDAKRDPLQKRLVRKDLQDFIDHQWNDGRDLASMPMNAFASDSELSDGLMVPRDKLASFDTEIPIDYKRHAKTGIKLSFVHLSDVQLRDERVYMFDKKLTKFLDYLADGFDQEPEMVFFDYAYYLTQIGIIKRLETLLPEGQRPAFMIHTGDALHMGVVSELFEFLYITNKLNIPWFNVLGNHDYQVYGNLHAKDVGVIKPNMGFQTINSRYNFINMHGKGFYVDSKVYFSPDNAPDSETKRIARSIYNGFDKRGSGFLESGRVRDRRNKPCANCPGYYHFEALPPKDGDPGILAVVLDTTTKDFRLAKGTVYRHNEIEGAHDNDLKYKQINWLKSVLEEYAKKGNWMVLAFGHHALQAASFFDDSYKPVVALFKNPKYNVAAYFCGHSHDHQIRYRKNKNEPNRFGFWEIVTDSIMEYPKRGSLVTVGVSEEGYWEISLQSFRPYFLNNLSADAPALLKNAAKCFEAAKTDREGQKKVKRFSALERKHYDVKLKFSNPK